MLPVLDVVIWVLINRIRHSDPSDGWTGRPAEFEPVRPSGASGFARPSVQRAWTGTDGLTNTLIWVKLEVRVWPLPLVL